MKRSCFAWHILICAGLLLHLTTGLAQYDEKYRDQYHFSPNSGWIGDPDGLFKFGGVYHLYWWGHATSSDLIHWVHQPYPIVGDPGSYGVNTGSAVVDKNNVASYGSNAVIAFPTLSAGHVQGVGLAYSNDSGFNFTLPNANALFGFSNNDNRRDPQVFWFPDSSKWVMVVGKGWERKVGFYQSTDLKTWNWVNDFGPSGGYSYDNWETPDLFPLRVDSATGALKWVLTVGVYPGGTGNDTVREAYHIGSFNGRTFTEDNPGVEYRLDNGLDFYAARTFRDYDVTQNQRTILGWMGSWAWSRGAPSYGTYKGQGIMSLPRDLALKTFPEGVRLTQTPIAGLTSLRQSPPPMVTNKKFLGTKDLSTYSTFSPSDNVYELDAYFNVSPTATFGFNLCSNSTGTKKLVVKFEGANNKLTIDRSTVSDNPPNSYFQQPYSAKVQPENNKLRLHIFVDRSSVEVFTNQGKIVMSMLTYAGPNQLGIQLFSTGDSTTLDSLKTYQLSSIWNPALGYRIDNHGIYKIVNRKSGKVLDAPGDDTTNGKQLQQWDYLGGNNQLWQVDSVTDPFYTIRSVSITKAVDLDGGSTSNGAKIQQWTYVNNVNQQWRIDDVGGGFFKVANQNAGDAWYNSIFEVEGGDSIHNGHIVQQWKFLGYRHQEWKFVKIASGSPVMLADPSPAPPAKHRFGIYPNPVIGNNFTIVSISGTQAQADGKIHSVRVIDANGVKVKEVSRSAPVSNLDMNVGGLSGQLYFVQIYDGKNWETHTIRLTGK